MLAADAGFWLSMVDGLLSGRPQPSVHKEAEKQVLPIEKNLHDRSACSCV